MSLIKMNQKILLLTIFGVQISICVRSTVCQNAFFHCVSLLNRKANFSTKWFSVKLAATPKANSPWAQYMTMTLQYCMCCWRSVSAMHVLSLLYCPGTNMYSAQDSRALISFFCHYRAQERNTMCGHVCHNFSLF